MESNLQTYCLQELEAYRKFKSSEKIIAFKEWFYKESELFTDVDKKMSEEVSLRNDCKIKECYRNTWISTSSFRTLKYYEGFVFSEDIPIPIEHSWLVTSDGKIVDPTLIINGKRLAQQLKKYKQKPIEKCGLKERKSRLGDEYFGVQIPTDFVNKIAIKEMRTGAFVYEYFVQKIMQQNLVKMMERTN